MKTSLPWLFCALLIAGGCKRPDSAQSDEQPAQSGETTGAARPAAAAPAPAADVQERAHELARRYIIVDGHIDLPYRLREKQNEPGAAVDFQSVIAGSDEGDFDHPRAVAGGLDAPFMSIYVPARHQEQGGAKKVADELIDMVERLVALAPDKFALARSVAEVRANKAAGKVSLPMGIENGAAIEDDLANLKHFYDRGVRYITLTHSKDNALCDSSYDKTRTHQGLSAMGKKAVAEMNRLGIMIDIAHVSDHTFNQVIELTKAPVIASHSSTRHFIPGFERNMSDDMIKKLAANRGVIMINFGSMFIKKESNEESEKRWAAMREFGEKHQIEFPHPRLEQFAEEYRKSHPVTYADLRDVVDHIDHVVKLVGVDHVGFGSDFDGVGDSLPTGLKDASMYPNLIAALLERGYSEADIEKICSGNVLRVWQAVEAHAAEHS